VIFIALTKSDLNSKSPQKRWRKLPGYIIRNEKMASEIGLCFELWKYRSKKIAAAYRASPLPQIALHRYWKSNFRIPIGDAFLSLTLCLSRSEFSADSLGCAFSAHSYTINPDFSIPPLKMFLSLSRVNVHNLAQVANWCSLVKTSLEL
jgi:hypothetical protein